MRVIAENLQKLDPKSDGAKRGWVAMYGEGASIIYQEIDYTKEIDNAEIFARIQITKIQALDPLVLTAKVDDVNGGRVIFYDFGMMGSISANIQEGLLEALYGVYEKDPNKVLQPMIQMGVLVSTGNMTVVRRTTQSFLNSFEECQAAQSCEREAATTKLGCEKPLSKEKKVKKPRLATIGEELLSIAADQPFRFPASITFAFRAFSVLDGIGKGLDPRFDITEIAKPYALELLRFHEAGVEVILKDFRKRWDTQSQAFYNLFRQADRIDKLAEIIQRLEQGDLQSMNLWCDCEQMLQACSSLDGSVNHVQFRQVHHMVITKYASACKAVEKIGPSLLKHLKVKRELLGDTSIAYINVGNDVIATKEQCSYFNLEDKVVPAEGTIVRPIGNEKR